MPYSPNQYKDKTQEKIEKTIKELDFILEQNDNGSNIITVSYNIDYQIFDKIKQIYIDAGWANVKSQSGGYNETHTVFYREIPMVQYFSAGDYYNK